MGKKMKLNKNSLIINLSIYIIIFAIVICIIGIIMNYFYENVNKMNSSLQISSDYSKLNLYFLKTTKLKNVTINNYGLVNNEDTSSYYITFSKNDGTTNTFVKIGDIIYFDKIKICENVEEFKIIVDKSERESISVETKISGKTFKSQYVLQ